MRLDAERLDWKQGLLLLAAALALFLPGFSTLPPVDRDESRYAVATTQMLTSGDFVDIRFQEDARHLQPAGAYWLQSATVAAFSDPEARAIWAHRLPSLAAALAAVLATAAFASLWLGARGGLLAGLLLASCMSLGFEARIAKTDATLLAAVTLAQFAFMALYTGRGTGRGLAALFWAALGFGALVKGPIILIVTGLCALLLLVWDRRPKRFASLRAAWGVPLALAIALPWYVAIGIVTDGGFFQTAIGDNLLHKVGTGQQSHGGPPGYHLIGFVLMFWPGALLAAAALPFVWRHRDRPEVRVLIAWIVPAWLVFEFVSTKLPHYVLPLYPAIAMLTAAAAITPGEPGPKWTRWLFFAYLVLWILVSGLLIGLAPAGAVVYGGRLPPLSVVLAVLAAVALVLMLMALARGRRDRAIVAGAVAAFFVTANTYGLVLPGLTSLWLSPQIAEAARAARPDCESVRIVTTPYHEPSLVFLNGSANTTLADTPDQAAQAMRGAGSCAVAVVGAEQQAAFLARAAALGLSLTPAGKVTGQNYSDGAELDLTLYVPGGA